MNAKYYLALIPLLAGCSPSIVTVPVPEYVAVPPALLQPYPCAREIVTNGDLIAAYANCLESNRRHEADKAAIRKLTRGGL